ncbi:MAG: hypothetical protein WA021_00225 [Minisyncoccia bacterium]
MDGTLAFLGAIVQGLVVVISGRILPRRADDEPLRPDKVPRTF